MIKVKIFPPYISSVVKKSELTMKLLSQLTAVAIATAVSISWIGYISELIVHGVVENPVEKNAKYKQIEEMNIDYPVSFKESKLFKYILNAISIKDIKIPGNTLSIIYLLPNLSIINIEIIDPIAFVKARGILKIIPNLFLSVILE